MPREIFFSDREAAWLLQAILADYIENSKIGAGFNSKLGKRKAIMTLTYLLLYDPTYTFSYIHTYIFFCQHYKVIIVLGDLQLAKLFQAGHLSKTRPVSVIEHILLYKILLKSQNTCKIRNQLINYTVIKMHS